MQIDVDRFEFGEVHNLETETEEVSELFAKLMAEGQIVAIADHKEQLCKLQDDLRRVGYRKLR